MKAIISCAMVLLMSVVSHGEYRTMDVHTDTGTIQVKLTSIDSVTFSKVWEPGDSLADARDGQKYATIKIGSQIWMAENLNVGTRINGADTAKNNGIIEKYAYNDKDSMANIYGGLYSWDEAMGYSTTAGVQGICPLGWHLPTDAEWKTLEMALGMTQTQADAINYRGSDQGTRLKVGGSSGFNALLSGYSGGSGAYVSLGTYTIFSTSSQYDAVNIWYRTLNNSVALVWRSSDSPKTGRICVRCIRD
jgi:uncharacterized protein (TIGR02145 family)